MIYIAGLTQFNHFFNSPLAIYGNKLYNLPFNVNTFHQLWDVTSPKEAKEKLEGQKQAIHNPRNLEEQALTLCGRDRCLLRLLLWCIGIPLIEVRA